MIQKTQVLRFDPRTSNMSETWASWAVHRDITELTGKVHSSKKGRVHCKSFHEKTNCARHNAMQGQKYAETRLKKTWKKPENSAVQSAHHMLLLSNTNYCQKAFFSEISNETGQCKMCNLTFSSLQLLFVTCEFFINQWGFWGGKEVRWVGGPGQRSSSTLRRAAGTDGVWSKK